MDMNDYIEYEKFEQARLYLEAAWLTAPHTTKCAQCAHTWIQGEYNQLVEKSMGECTIEH